MELFVILAVFLLSIVQSFVVSVVVVFTFSYIDDAVTAFVTNEGAVYLLASIEIFIFVLLVKGMTPYLFEFTSRYVTTLSYEHVVIPFIAGIIGCKYILFHNK